MDDEKMMVIDETDDEVVDVDIDDDEEEEIEEKDNSFVEGALAGTAITLGTVVAVALVKKGAKVAVPLAKKGAGKVVSFVKGIGKKKTKSEDSDDEEVVE